jgi:hypothetical protein
MMTEKDIANELQERYKLLSILNNQLEQNLTIEEHYKLTKQYYIAIGNIVAFNQVLEIETNYIN